MPSLSGWLKRFRKSRQIRQENQYVFPAITTAPQGDYILRHDYEALAQRVSAIERKFDVSQSPEDRLEFPSEILANLPPVVKKTIEGIILNYELGFPDFCFFGMRKALIDAIRIRFQRDGKENMLYNKKGEAFKLPRWIDLAKQERYISRTMARDLREKVKVFGDTASHDYMANLQKEEVPSVCTRLRIALSRMYYLEH